MLHIPQDALFTIFKDLPVKNLYYLASTSKDLYQRLSSYSFLMNLANIKILPSISNLTIKSLHFYEKTSIKDLLYHASVNGDVELMCNILHTHLDDISIALWGLAEGGHVLEYQKLVVINQRITPMSVDEIMLLHRLHLNQTDEVLRDIQTVAINNDDLQQHIINYLITHRFYDELKGLTNRYYYSRRKVVDEAFTLGDEKVIDTYACSSRIDPDLINKAISNGHVDIVSKYAELESPCCGYGSKMFDYTCIEAAYANGDNKMISLVRDATWFSDQDYVNRLKAQYRPFSGYHDEYYSHVFTTESVDGLLKAKSVIDNRRIHGIPVISPELSYAIPVIEYALEQGAIEFNSYISKRRKGTIDFDSYISEIIQAAHKSNNCNFLLIRWIYEMTGKYYPDFIEKHLTSAAIAGRICDIREILNYTIDHNISVEKETLIKVANKASAYKRYFTYSYLINH